ncbi:MAG: hypothetical protein ACKOPM_15085, partial [Novosphingobium sp.]
VDLGLVEKMHGFWLTKRAAFDKLRLSGGDCAMAHVLGWDLAQAGARMVGFENRSGATCWS